MPLRAGDADPDFAGFGNSGERSAGTLRVNAVARQEDGRLLAAGYTLAPGGGTEVPAVARYLAGGETDMSFGSNGQVALDVAEGGRGYDMALQPDGKILLTGYLISGGESDFFVVRLHPNGGYDSGFGVNGFAVVDVSGPGDVGRALALQPDGKIVVAGQAEVGDDDDFAVVRLDADGSLDTTFSGDGMATTGFGGYYGDDAARAIALQPDGKIVLAGQADESNILDLGNDHDFGLARYNANGSLDVSFDGDGKRQVGFGSNSESALAVDVAADGRLIVAGYGSEDFRMSAAVLLPDGSYDNSWGNGGKWEHTPGSSARVVQWLAGGGALLAGYTGSGAVMVRLTAAGAPDATFDGDGFAGAGAERFPEDMLVDPSGRILLAMRETNSDDLLARFLAGGAPDGGGQTTADYAADDERGYGVAVQADGKIVTAGEAQSPLAFFERDVMLLRTTAAGQPDVTFGEQGRVVYGLPGDDVGRALAIQPDGKLIVGGFREQVDQLDFAVWRFEADGTLDLSFGSGGMRLVDFSGVDDYGQALVLQADGKIVIAGFSDDAGTRMLALARLTAGGDLDGSFGNGGKLTRSIGGGFVSLRGLEQLPGGDLLAVGGHAGDFYAWRLSPEGEPVASFGSNGYAEYPLPGNDQAWAAGALSSGVVVIGGGSSGNFMLLFVNEDGSMCLSACHFVGEGRLLVDFGADEQAYDLHVQENNRILLVGGGNVTDPAVSDFMLARVSARSFPSPGYGLDGAFGEGGKVRTSFAAGRSLARSAWVTNEWIVAAGYADNGRDDDVALVRYENDGQPLPPPGEEEALYLPLLRR